MDHASSTNQFCHRKLVNQVKLDHVPKVLIQGSFWLTGFENESDTQADVIYTSTTLTCFKVNDTSLHIYTLVTRSTARCNEIGSLTSLNACNSGASSSDRKEPISPHRAVPSTTLAKKKNHHRDSRREERCSTCDIMLDQPGLAQGKSDPRLLPCADHADHAWSSMISHVEQRSSRRESRGWFFFLARVVQPLDQRSLSKHESS